jgi:hypothetical protein
VQEIAVSEPTRSVLELARVTLTGGVRLEAAAGLSEASSPVTVDWINTAPLRTINDLALDGMLAIETLKLEHPAWFAAAVPYPDEDFSSPDLSDLEVDLSE